jgi:hypothetical protein
MTPRRGGNAPFSLAVPYTLSTVLLSLWNDALNYRPAFGYFPEAGFMRLFGRAAARRPRRQLLYAEFVFEKDRSDGNRALENGLNLSRNSFLFSVSQKVGYRLSFESVHDDQTENDRSPNCAVEAPTSAIRAEGCASAII